MCHVSGVTSHMSQVMCQVSSSKQLDGQIIRAWEQSFTCDISYVMCLVSCVTSHKTCVLSHVSGVTCHLQKHLHGQTVRSRELNFLQKVHLPQPVTCHVSCVTSMVSLQTTSKPLQTSFLAFCRWLLMFVANIFPVWAQEALDALGRRRDKSGTGGN